MTKRLLRREQVVAASLVGAVVVVVGYASGFGVRPNTDADRAVGNGAGVPEEVRPPVTVAELPPTSTVPAQPVANVPQNPVVPRPPAPTTGPPPSLPAQPQHPHPTVPTVPTTPTRPTTPAPPPPPPECAPGLVPVALDTLLLTLGRATDALGLPLLGGVPLAPTGLPLLGAAPLVPVDLPLPVANGPLDQLIGVCVPAPTVEPPR